MSAYHAELEARASDTACEKIKQLKPLNSGFIVRTAGEERDEADLANDIEFLTRLSGKQ